jgi:hypothetical protein
MKENIIKEQIDEILVITGVKIILTYFVVPLSK